MPPRAREELDAATFKKTEETGQGKDRRDGGVNNDFLFNCHATTLGTLTFRGPEVNPTDRRAVDLTGECLIPFLEIFDEKYFRFPT